MKSKIFLNLNEFILSNIQFNDIIHNKVYGKEIQKVYFIDMFYTNSIITIQLPKCKIYNIINENLILDINSTEISTFFISLEEYIINCIYNKSEKWFNGKQFTINKIKECLISPLSKDKKLLNLTLNDNTMLFDQYKNNISKISIDNILEIVCLIEILNLQFLNNEFTYNISVKQVKTFDKEKEIVIISEYSSITSNTI